MKKISSMISLFVTSLSYLSLTASAYAQNICPTGQFASLCTLKLNSSTNLIGRVITIFLIVAVILALFFLILGSIRWITSGGDKGKVEGARSAIVASIVGLILAFLAYFILNVITFIFTKNSINNFTIQPIVP